MNTPGMRELADELRMWASAIDEAARGSGTFPNAWQLETWLNNYRKQLERTP